VCVCIAAAVVVSAFVLVNSYSGGAIQLGSVLLLVNKHQSTELAVRVRELAPTGDCSSKKQ
jgi:hypothetical protein